MHLFVNFLGVPDDISILHIEVFRLNKPLPVPTLLYMGDTCSRPKIGWSTPVAGLPSMQPH